MKTIFQTIPWEHEYAYETLLVGEAKIVPMMPNSLQLLRYTVDMKGA